MNTKVCSSCKEEKTRCSFHKDSKSKDGLRYSCKCCVKKMSKSYHNQNREQILSQKREYYLKNCRWLRIRNKNSYKLNRSERLKYAKTYREENFQEVSEVKKQWYQKNHERVLAKNKDYYQQNRDEIIKHVKKYRQCNKEKVACWSAKYRSLKQEGLPKAIVKCPVEKDRLNKIYKLRDVMTKATGVQYHVDHIWPLSKSGPHWSGNLQIITAEENLSKGDTLCEETARVIQESLDEYCSARQ